MFKAKFGETPRTTFYNLYEPVIAVETPRRAELLPRLRKVIGATWAEDIAEAMELGQPDKLFHGTALWQGLEFFQVFVTIEHVTRVFTHQLVRMRIGATYSQQCSGDMDWRHQPVLVPPSVAHLSIQRWMQHMLQAKLDYAKLVDLGMSIQEARYLLPQCLSTFIIMNTNLAALVPWVAKRTCVQTQAWEMITVAKIIRAHLLDQWPELAPLFQDPCIKGQCFWARSIKAGDAAAHTNLYKPDHFHPPEFLATPSVYDKTHQEIVGGPTLLDPRRFVGLEEVK